MAFSPTPVQILSHVTHFLTSTISQPDLLPRLYATFLHKLQASSSSHVILQPLNIAAETLHTHITTTTTSTNRPSSSTSLRLTEKLLLSYPPNPFSSFLLSLLYTLTNRPTDAAIHFLDVFCIDPCLARVEIAPSLYEEVFLGHVFPAVEGMNERRGRVMSEKSLARMSGGQAREMKELQLEYEAVVDANCRKFAVYLKEVLQGRRLSKTPSLVMTICTSSCGGGGGGDDDVSCASPGTEGFGLSCQRYNVM